MEIGICAMTNLNHNFLTIYSTYFRPSEENLSLQFVLNGKRASLPIQSSQADGMVLTANWVFF